MTIQLEETEKKGRASAKENGTTLAEMTFSKAGAHLLIINHTDVDESLRGQGVGRKMLDKIVEHAREHQLKIMPLCPFAKSVFNKDQSIADVLR